MKIQYHWDLNVYKSAINSRSRIFELSKCFLKEELYSLTNQIRRSSRAVCAQIAEAWGRRIYKDDFVNRLNLAEREARETQCWLETSAECNYITSNTSKALSDHYHNIIGQLNHMENHPENWIIRMSK